MLLASSPLSPDAYIGGGLVVLALILFAETGLLIGFFLPGDTLLILAGFHTKSGQADHLDFGLTAVVLVLAAIIGAQTGFALGRAAGSRLFDRPSRRQRVEQTRRLLHRFGEGKAVVAARFVPVARTFMNPAVGVTGMPARDFLAWNAVGALVWVPLVLFLGRLLPASLGKKVDYVILGVVVLSLALPVVEFLRGRARARG